MRINILIIVALFFLPLDLLSQGNLYLEAKVASESNLHEKAVQLLNNYLTKYPKSSHAIFLRAQSNLELSNYQKVIDDIRLLKTTYHKDILLMQARSNSGLGKKDLSIEQLDKYLQSTKKIPAPVIQSYAEFQQLKQTDHWKSLWANERYTKKEQLLNNAIYAIKSERYAEAEDRLNELINRYSRSHKALYLRGKLLFEKKDYAGALKDFENAVKLEDDELEYQCALAQCYAKLKRGKKAVQKFKEVISEDTLFIAAYLGRAEAYLVSNDYENAEEDIAKYRFYYPSNLEAQYLNAAINVKTGDFLSAISTYGKLIKSDASKTEYFVGRAKSYMATKTYKYAIKDFSMALDLDPKNIEVYKLKALAHKDNGEIEKACIEWKYAAKLGDVDSMDNLKKYCK